jgi:hypothetical protein
MRYIHMRQQKILISTRMSEQAGSECADGGDLLATQAVAMYQVRCSPLRDIRRLPGQIRWGLRRSRLAIEELESAMTTSPDHRQRRERPRGQVGTVPSVPPDPELRPDDIFGPVTETAVEQCCAGRP